MLHTEAEKKMCWSWVIMDQFNNRWTAYLSPHLPCTQIAAVGVIQQFKHLSPPAVRSCHAPGWAPDSFTTWQGDRVGGGIRDTSRSWWAALLPQQALCTPRPFASCAMLRNWYCQWMLQVPLVPVSSYHTAACDSRGLDLVTQVRFWPRIRD